MKTRPFVRCGVGAILALGAAFNPHAIAGSATVATFDAGRFLASTGEVYSGVFGDTVTVDALTIGQATFRARFDELIDVASVRVYVAPALDADGPFKLLTDEQVASGEFGVGFGLGREIIREAYSTTLDVMQGLDLSRMLYTDGAVRVRVDVLLTSPLRDSQPGQHDFHPEALLLGSFNDHDVRVAAIVGGNVDRPILAGDAAHIDRSGFDRGQTGVSIVLDRDPLPKPVSIVGLDLYALGVGDETPVLGYRIEIEPGEPAIFNIAGVGRDWQRGLATPIALYEDEEGGGFDLVDGADDDWALLSAFGDLGIAMSQPLVRRSVGGGGGFGGGGGGGGGGGLPGSPFTGGPPDNSNGNGDDPGDPGNPGNGNGNGDGNGNGNGNGDPVIPAPGTLLIVLGYAAGCRRRRRREE